MLPASRSVVFSAMSTWLKMRKHLPVSELLREGNLSTSDEFAATIGALGQPYSRDSASDFSYDDQNYDEESGCEDATPGSAMNNPTSALLELRELSTLVRSLLMQTADVKRELADVSSRVASLETAIRQDMASRQANFVHKESYAERTLRLLARNSAHDGKSADDQASEDSLLGSPSITASQAVGSLARSGINEEPASAWKRDIFSPSASLARKRASSSRAALQTGAQVQQSCVFVPTDDEDSKQRALSRHHSAVVINNVPSSSLDGRIERKEFARHAEVISSLITGMITFIQQHVETVNALTYATGPQKYYNLITTLVSKLCQNSAPPIEVPKRRADPVLLEGLQRRTANGVIICGPTTVRQLRANIELSDVYRCLVRVLRAFKSVPETLPAPGAEIVMNLMEPIVSSQPPELPAVDMFNLDYSKLKPRDPTDDEKAFTEIGSECIEEYVKSRLFGETPKSARDKALQASSRVKEAKNMRKLGNKGGSLSSRSFSSSSSASTLKPTFQLDLGLDF